MTGNCFEETMSLNIFIIKIIFIHVYSIDLYIRYLFWHMTYNNVLIFLTLIDKCGSCRDLRGWRNNSSQRYKWG
jgi:type IV secretory pathway VirB3-like protein